MSSLLTTQGILFGTRFPIRETLTFGRSSSATVQLADLQVSRMHAVIRAEEGSYVLLDASSRNGTLVNGKRVQGRRVLQKLDEIQVGSSHFIFEADEECLGCRDGSSWIVLGGRPVEGEMLRRLRNPMSAEEITESNPISPLGAFGELTNLPLTSLDEDALALDLLVAFKEWQEADRGALFSVRKGDFPIPLAISPQNKHFPINASLFGCCLQGTPVSFSGTVELTSFPKGRRKVNESELAIVAVPWRRGGDVAGIVWLERDARKGPFGSINAGKLEDLLALVGPALDNARRARMARRHQRSLQACQEEERISGQHLLECTGLYEQACQLARSSLPVSVVGPRGMGKTRIARLLHASSFRWDAPFIRVNCAILTERQSQYELFGLERGVLPGLDHPIPGKLELADGGTLVLEQVDALRQPVQNSLIRALAFRHVIRDGGEQPIPIDVRIISTASESLEDLSGSGRLRSDLLPYLGEKALTIPGLNNLKNQIVQLVLAAIAQANVRLAKNIRGVSAWAEQSLCQREWILNLREMEDLVFRAVALAEGSLVTREDLDLAEVIPSRRAMTEATSGWRPDLLSDVEKRLLIHALRLTKGEWNEAAKLMGIPRELLEQKILDYAIDPRER